MDENLIGYLLNALEPEEQRQVEVYLAGNPEARQRLRLLRQALAPLDADADGDEVEPPAGLAVRTLARVQPANGELPRAPALRTRYVGPSGRSFWRRADVLVAASVLFLATGVASAWLVHIRQSHDLVACQNNLRELYEGLRGYSEQHHNRFPNPAEAAPRSRAVAGLVVPILASAGHLPSDTSVRCPGTGGAPLFPAFTLEKVLSMSDADFQLDAVRLACSYGYSLGYVDPDGNYEGPRFDPRQPISQLPIMSDCPPLDLSLGNSPNHDGLGQNVLYTDGHVRFCTSRRVGFFGDDIFTNRQHQVAAGVDVLDTVLGRSSARP
jgi:prepilin-type processing-associated H-X9-DG protein